LAGAALGGIVGGFIGADIDRKRCELSKVAKQHNLEMVFSTVDVAGNTNAIGSTQGDSQVRPATTSADAIIGNSVSVRDKDGHSGHFEIGSAELTAKAREYFSAIAAQYSVDALVSTQTDPRQKEEIRKQLAQRKILLVGHTDDTGSSVSNADLSEKRARAVASLLRQKGVPEANLFYQGAGETLPVADNRTAEGRAANRRVEIIEIADEEGFKKYLDNRTPQYAFYRPASVQEPAVAKPPNIASSAPPAPAREVPAPRAVPNSQSSRSVLAQRPTAGVKPPIDFGGAPYTPLSARIDSGPRQNERGFSLISSAFADDNIVTVDCSRDRPRSGGSVKSLREGSSYRTTEYLPQLYGKTWASQINGHLLVINQLTILRNGGTPGNLPELKIYPNYRPVNPASPQISEEPQVNSYLVEKGVLYRIFTSGQGGLKCLDVLFVAEGGRTARAGKLIYSAETANLVADFKLQLQ
jgi:outer membrane protein OmpA-like peptidoglycan-associated protein